MKKFFIYARARVGGKHARYVIKQFFFSVTIIKVFTPKLPLKSKKKIFKLILVTQFNCIIQWEIEGAMCRKLINEELNEPYWARQKEMPSSFQILREIYKHAL